MPCSDYCCDLASGCGIAVLCFALGGFVLVGREVGYWEAIIVELGRLVALMTLTAVL
jgi:hypothetical protein